MIFFARLPMYSCDQNKLISSVELDPRADHTVTQSHRLVPCNKLDYDQSQDDKRGMSNARKSQESSDITSGETAPLALLLYAMNWSCVIVAIVIDPFKMT